MKSIEPIKDLVEEVILVDNASSDDSVEFVKKNFTWVNILRNPTNLGYAGGNNVGMRFCRSKYAFLLNNDTILDCKPKDVQEIVELLEQHNEVAAIALPVLIYGHDELVNAAGVEIDIYGYAKCRGIFMPFTLYIKKDEVFSAYGAAMIIRKSAFDIVSGFDEKMFLMYEDVDLCWRFRLFGYKIIYVPLLKVKHVMGGTWGKMTTLQKYYTERNRLYTLIKNYDILSLLQVISQYLALKALEIILFTFYNNPSMIISICKGLIWNFKHFRQNWKIHSIVHRKIKRVADKQIKSVMVHSSLEIHGLLQILGTIRFYKYVKAKE